MIRGSHPTRGAWIEIACNLLSDAMQASHPTRGAWIEIFHAARQFMAAAGRTPHGVRGLKLSPLQYSHGSQSSHPTRGARIEITWRTSPPSLRWSHPTRGAWI